MSHHFDQGKSLLEGVLLQSSLSDQTRHYAMVNLASLLHTSLEAGNQHRCLELLTQLVEEVPTNEVYIALLGNVLHRCGRYLEAKTQYLKVKDSSQCAENVLIARVSANEVPSEGGWPAMFLRLSSF